MACADQLLAAFPTSRIPVVAATVCVVPFLLDPAAALGRVSPWHMKLRCLDLVAAFLLGVSSVVCTRQPPGCVCVGTLFPACLVLRPCVVAPPTNCVRFCPGALACGRSCFAHVRPCAQGRCGRCPPGSGVMSELFSFLFFSFGGRAMHCVLWLGVRLSVARGALRWRCPGVLQKTCSPSGLAYHTCIQHVRVNNAYQTHEKLKIRVWMQLCLHMPYGGTKQATLTTAGAHATSQLQP